MSKYIDAEKLLAEIERRKADAKLYDMSGGDATIYDELLSIITSLQEEQPKQDITEFEKALDDFGEAYATLVDRDNNPNQGIRLNAYNELVQEKINDILSLAKEYIKQEQPDVDLEKEVDKTMKRFFNRLTCREEEIKFARHFYALGQSTKYQQDRSEFAKLKAKEWQEGYDEGYAKGLTARNEELSLPSNLDEAAEEWCKTNNKGIALSADKKSHYLAEGKDAFKAGAEWMAGQGVAKEAVIGMATEEISINVSQQILNELDLCPGDKVVVQIRKK